MASEANGSCKRERVIAIYLQRKISYLLADCYKSLKILKQKHEFETA